MLLLFKKKLQLLRHQAASQDLDLASQVQINENWEVGLRQFAQWFQQRENKPNPKCSWVAPWSVIEIMLELLLTLLPFICTAMYRNASVPQKQLAQIIQSLFIGWSTAVESEAFKGLRADKNLKNFCDLITFGKLSRPFCSISKSYISVKKVKAA